MRWRSMVASLLAVTGGGACTPTLDWREVRPEGSGVRALFPCKPVSLARQVVLAGASARMTIHACSADGVLFALGFADVGERARVAPALAELRAAAARNLGASVDLARPLSIAGMTPNAQAVRLRLAGNRPDGSAVREEMALFARRTTVYQVTLLGLAVDAAVAQAFVEGLKVGP